MMGQGQGAGDGARGNAKGPAVLRPAPFPRPSPLAPRPPEGFSLIELVISMAILSIGLVGAMRVFPVGLRASRRSEMSSRAVITAQRLLESYKLKTWEELAPGETTTAADPFTVEMAVATPQVEGLVDSDRLKALTLTVRWQEDGRPRALAFITHVRRPSPVSE